MPKHGKPIFRKTSNGKGWEKPKPILMPMSLIPREKTITWEPGLCLEALKLWAILQALEEYGGNRSKAARSLGVSVRCIRNRIIQLKKLGYEI